jgi:hypothetical protein
MYRTSHDTAVQPALLAPTYAKADNSSVPWVARDTHSASASAHVEPVSVRGGMADNSPSLGCPDLGLGHSLL